MCRGPSCSFTMALTYTALTCSYCGGFAELSHMRTTAVILSFLHRIVLSSLVVMLYKLVHVYRHHLQCRFYAMLTPALSHRLPFP